MRPFVDVDIVVDVAAADFVVIDIIVVVFDCRISHAHYTTGCCQDGCVSTDVIKSVKAYVPELYSKLPTNKERQLQLPTQWTKHAAVA
jgi:hypothetical protein